MAGENVGRAFVEIRADGTKFEKDIKEILDRIDATKTIQLKAEIDLSKVRADLDSLKDQHPINLKADIDLTKVRADIAALRAEEEVNGIRIKADADTSRATEDIRRVGERSKSNPISISTAADTAILSREIRDVADSISRDVRPAITPTVNTAPARAQANRELKPLKWDLLPKIPDDVLKGLRGLGYSLIGAIPFDSYVKVISEMAAEFENASFKANQLITKFGAIGAAAVAAGTDVFVLGGDLTKLIGFMALGPATFTAYGSAMIVLRESFKNFSAAIGGSTKALSSFSAPVQKIILQLQQLSKGFKEPIQNAFWADTVGPTLIKLAKNDLPVVRDAFAQTAKQLGGIFSEVLNGMDRWVQGGGFKTTFDNINQGWANAAKGVGPFTDALNKLSEAGSRFFPAVGDAAAKAADKFNQFVTAAIQSGRFLDWVNGASHAFKDLWGILGNTLSILSSITKASRDAGANGLDALASGVKKVAGYLKSEPFQSQFVFFLQEVRGGAELLFKGFGNLAQAVGKFSASLGGIVQFAAGSGGLFLNDLSAFFSAPRLGTGIQTAIEGFQTALLKLKPAFKDIGNAIGDLGTMAGPMVEMTVDGLAHMIDTVSKVIANLRDGFASSIPVFNNFMQGIIGVASGPIIELAKIIGNILSAFAALPAPVQNAIMLFGLIGVAVTKVLGAFKGFSGKLQDTLRGVEANGIRTGGVLDRIAWSRPGAEAIGAWKNFGDTVKITSGLIKGSFSSEVGDAATLMRNNIATELRAVGSSLKDFGSNLRAAGQHASDFFTGASKFKMPNLFGEMVPMVQKIPNLFQQAGASIKSAMIDDIVFHWKRGMADWEEISANFKLSNALKLNAQGEIVKQGLSDIVNSAKTHLSMLPILAQQAGTGLSNSFAAMGESAKQHLSLLGAYAKGAGESMATAFRPGTNAIRGFFEDIPNWLTKSGIDVYGAAGKIKEAYTGLSDKAVVTGKLIGNGLGSAAQTVTSKMTAMATTVGDRMTAMGRTVQEKVGGSIDSVKSRISSLGDGLSRFGSTMSTFFQPLVTAGKGVGTALAETGKGIAGVAGAVKTVAGETVKAGGMMADAGLKAAGKSGLGALAGIMDAMGGPWGAAIGVATAAIGIWAEKQAEVKQRVDNLTQSIDKQSKSFNESGLQAIAKQWTQLDQAASSMDNFFRSGKAANEMAQHLNVSLSDVTKAIASGGGDYDALHKNVATMASEYERLERATHGLMDVKLGNLTAQGKEAAAAMHLTDDMLKGLTKGDWDNFNKQLEDGRKEAQMAQIAYAQLGDATGSTSVSAQQMAAAMQTIGDKSMDASGKIAAINKALDLLKNGGKLDVQAAESNTRSAMDSAVSQAQAVADKIAGLKGDYSSILDANNMLKTASSSTANEVYKSMSSATDAIKIQAQSVYQATLDSTGDASKAADAAAKIVGDSNDKLDEIAKAAGIPAEKLKDQWQKFFGADWQLKATFSANAQKVQAALELAKKAGLQWDGDKFTAWLLAHPEEAQKSAQDAAQDAVNFAQGQYVAQLKALPNDAQKTLAEAIGKTNTDWTWADWTAILKAAQDNPSLAGVVASLAAVETNNGLGREAIIKAVASGVADAQAQLDSITATRTANIVANIVNGGGGVPAGSKGYGLPTGPSSANGSIMDALGRGMFGFNPKYFANGGIENHVAQIAMPGAVPRIWAESETGGEAYIPLGLDKRTRSVKILEQVAELFGMSLMKKMAFADGGILRTMPTTSALDTYRTTQTQNTPTPKPYAMQTAGGINLNVYPSQGLSEKQIGESAATALYWNMMTLPR